MLFPAMPRSAGDVLRIAHRSLDGAANPALVCRELVDQGAHLVELDVRISADEKLFVWHDPWLMSENGRRWLRDTPSDRVPERIGRLADVLGIAADVGLGVYLDIKTLTVDAAGALLASLHDAGLTQRCVLASARSDIVATLSRLTTLPRAVLFRALDEDPLQLAESVGASFVHPCWEQLTSPHRELTAEWLARLAGHGVGVICWHEERPDELTALLELGVDGICTDDMPLLRRLASRELS